MVFVSHFAHTGLKDLFDLDVEMFWPIFESCERIYKQFAAIPQGVVMLDPEKL